MTERPTAANDRPSPRIRLLVASLLLGVGCGVAGISAAAPPAAPAATPAVKPAAPAPAPTVPPAPEKKRNIGGPGDYALRQRLVEQIGKDPELAQEKFSIVLVNGGAVFSGPIRSCALKMRLLRLTALQGGIINITDEMEVSPGQVSDVALRDAVEAQLTDKNAAFAIRDLQVAVEDGVATLTGKVDTYVTRVRAEQAAGTVLGVRRVSNHLLPVDAPSGTDDATLTRAVIGYLGDFRQFGYPADLQVKTTGGIVTLTGRTSLLQPRQLAGALTALVGGVKGVDNRIVLDMTLLVQHRTIVGAAQ